MVAARASAAPAARAAPSSPTPSAAPATSAATGACPLCGEPRSDDDARYCEVCRYDFATGKPGPPPGVPAAAPPVPQVPPTPARRPVLVVSVDAQLDTDPDPGSPPPSGVAPWRVPADRPELLVGRRDDRRDIKPDIPVNDPGASRRHLKFLVGTDGQVVLLDLASTNGTRLNGVEVPPGSRHPLSPGDEVVVGRWTRIRLEDDA
jgi:hypothetical protein